MKRVTFKANLGLVGCDQIVGEWDYYDDEFEAAVDSGEIYAHGEEFVQQYLDVTYVVEEIEEEGE